MTAVIKLQDCFSGTTDTIQKEVDQETFYKMVNGVGSIFSKYDPVQGIRYDWKVLSVNQVNN